MFTRIMGIINANDDSFFASSRFLEKDAIDKIELMIKEGANIIDVGAVSSRPGAKEVSVSNELERFTPIANLIFERELYKQAEFSIDSYTPEVIEYALERGFSMVNDITGLRDDRVCELIHKYNATAIIMHMQGNPTSMQKSPKYSDVIEEVYSFFTQQIEKAHRYKIDKIILDVGIGFGKTLEHNIALLQNLKKFKTLGYELLVGASRKSMIDMISSSKVDERLAGTIVLHVKAVKEGAQILRVHDVFEHNQALKVYEAIDSLHE